MTRRARRELAIGALLVSAAACGGGGAGSAVSRSAPRETHPAVITTATTTAFASPTSTATRVVAGPPIVDRGADVVEVARSLLLFGRWLEAEHPDPALVDRAFAWEGNLARSVGADVTTLERTGRRIIEVDAAPLEFVVVSRLPNVVSFRLTEYLDHRDLVDASGRVLDHVGPATERYVVLIHRFSPDEPWRLSGVDRMAPDVEIQL
jgi:hypothetical protein